MPGNKGGHRERLPHTLADLKRLSKMAAEAAIPAPAPKPPAATKTTQIGKTNAEPGLSQEDTLLFRRTVKTVTPIKDTHRALLPINAAGPSDILRQRREHAMGREPVRLAQTSDHYSPAKVDGDDSRYLRPGHGSDVIKHLKQGKWPMGASLDLHGSTLDEARERLDRFLQSCMAHQIKCVRIVHGKGYGSGDDGPVLKQTVRRWLSQIAGVIAYVECSEQDGGAGAVQVLLQAQASPSTPQRT